MTAIALLPTIPKPTTCTPLIHLAGIGKDYRMGETAVTVLRDVTLQLERGCFTAIAGPSGGGKSTLLNVLGCLDSPSRGEYRLEGEIVDAMDPARAATLRRERFGFVFQSFNLMPVLTAVENVELALAHLRLSATMSRRRALEMLEHVGLAPHAKKRPAQLSGGQQQRVAIARALVKWPSVILADEPTANLDEESTETIVALMRRLNAEDGVSFVIATHDPVVYRQARATLRIVGGTLVGGPI